MKHWFAVVALAAASVVHASPSIEDFVKAAEFNDPRVIEKQLQQGVDPNLTDSRGRSALFTAVREGSDRALGALLASDKVNVDAANADGETPLMLAAIRGSLPMAQALVKRGASVNRAGWTPLHYACSGPDNGVAAYLLAQGADINARSENGTTPLMMAARYGNADLVPLLLKAGAEPRAANEQELTAADFAQRSGRDGVARQLRALMQDRQRASGAAASGR
jgi:ankyrin repeat protein